VGAAGGGRGVEASTKAGGRIPSRPTSASSNGGGDKKKRQRYKFKQRPPEVHYF